MNKVGNNGFAILTVVFFLGTYALALSLENIIDQFERFRREKWGRPGKSDKTDRSSDVRNGDEPASKLSFNVMGSCFGLRRRREFADGSEEGEEKISEVA